MPVQLPFGVNSSGRLIAIHDAERGLSCLCTCPECDRRLVAHEADADCAGAVESMLHRLAKQAIADAGHVWFPESVAQAYGVRRHLSGPGIFQAAVVEIERAIEDIRPDAILTHASDAMLAVEVYVTHAVTAAKAARYAELNLACIEIDLSLHHGPHRGRTPPDHLPNIILQAAPRRWIYSPKITAACADLGAEHEARELAKRQRAAAEAIERARIEEARLAQEAERWAQLTAEQQERERQRKAEEEANQARWAAYQAQEAIWQEEWNRRLAALAAERAEAEHIAGRHWRFGVSYLARKFLIQNDAEAWLALPLPGHPHSLTTWPIAVIPDAAALDAIYDAVWAEIKAEGRYRGP